MTERACASAPETLRPPRALAVALAGGWLATAGAAELLHAVAARWDLVSALLSPGAVARGAALVFGALFLALRLSVLVLWPSAAGAFLGFLAGCGVARAFRAARGSP